MTANFVGGSDPIRRWTYTVNTEVVRAGGSFYPVMDIQNRTVAGWSWLDERGTVRVRITLVGGVSSGSIDRSFVLADRGSQHVEYVNVIGNQLTAKRVVVNVALGGIGTPSPHRRFSVGLSRLTGGRNQFFFVFSENPDGTGNFVNGDISSVDFYYTPPFRT